MALEFDIIDDPPADSPLWKTWKFLVDTEGWTSDDNSVTLLTPGLETTHSVFAVTKNDGNYIGAVIWNDYDNVSFLGFFLLAPEYRGKGCGMKIWNRAISRMPKEHVIALRGVPNMVEKYKKTTTPVDGPKMWNYRMTTKELQQVLSEHKECTEFHSKLVSELTNNEWTEMLNFDKEVTGRDRHQFLETYYKKLTFTTGMVLFDKENGKIIAHVSVVPTSHPDDKLLKIAPLYANSDEIAVSALKAFSYVLTEKFADSRVVMHILDTPKGNYLDGLFKNLSFEQKESGVTLFSKEMPKYGDEERVYITHNNSCHYDY